MRKIRAEIHLGNIRRNAETFSALTGKKLCAVVKANAYGHGAEEVVNALNGVADCFAVALLDEAIAIRGCVCGKDILIFTPPLSEEEVYLATSDGFVLSVSDLWTAKLIASTCAKHGLQARVHLKINTGMNRYGMNLSMLGKVCTFFRNNPFVRVEGIYSHLYECAYETANTQRELFVRAVNVCKRYFPTVISHLSATYGALLGQEFAFDMVRIGIGLYGYLPVGEANAKNGVSVLPTLEKGMTVYAAVAATRKYSHGGMGYGKTPEGPKPKRLHLCRFGYADGFLRRKDNGTTGAEKNVNALCMDVCIRNGGGKRGRFLPVMTDADGTAKETGTISYEVLCAATRRAEFVYDNE